MDASHLSALPRIIYGTAWKKEKTTECVVRAVSNGFRAIDTACQPKHYREDLVGEALSVVYSTQGLQRSDIFIQTKFTAVDGQDPLRIPYDQRSSLDSQVQQSFTVSLKNLKTEYIDSLLIHSPLSTHSNTITVWQEFEKLHREGKLRFLGISNIYNLKTLENLYSDAAVKPSFVQNRFYRQTGYDVGIREFCKAHDIIYQSFWTLTANPHIVQNPHVVSIAKREGKTPEQVFFRFVTQLGIVPLTGTTNEQHMKQDLQVLDMPLLSQSDFNSISSLIN